MNIHSKKISMARIIDTARIESLEEAAVSLVVEKGFASSSVSDIATYAGISVGYLYSHFQSKEDLILSIYEKNIGIFDDFIDDLLATSETVSYFTDAFVRYMFDRANEYPVLVRFLLLLVYESTFDIPAMRLKKTGEQCRKILSLGAATGEIDPAVTAEEIYVVYFSIPLKFMENRLERSHGQGQFTYHDAERVSLLCLRAVA